MIRQRKIIRKSIKKPKHKKELTHWEQILWWERYYKSQLGWSHVKLNLRILDYRQKHPKHFPRISYLYRWGKVAELYKWFWDKYAHRRVK